MTPDGNSSLGEHMDKGAQTGVAFKLFCAGQKLRQQILPRKVAAGCSYTGTGRSCVQLDFGGREFFEKEVLVFDSLKR
jgi:hypothetical protein